MLRILTATSVLSLLAGLVFLAAGCNRTQTQVEPSTTQKHSDSPDEAEHGHAPGAHGGTIVEIGRDNYHAEIVFEKDGVLRLFTLGNDEAKVQEVESQTITAYARPAGGGDSVSFELKPVPQPGDAEGMTSQFVGTLPSELTGQGVEVTIPSLRINEERFRLGFSSPEAAHAEHGGVPLPAKATSDEEAALYLTPGGKYTVDDIVANGNRTASQKYKGLRAAHDLEPAPGDKICPITLTKANPQFSWTIGGETYQFCCPPCVDEFVRLAKEDPDAIKNADSYVKQ